MKLCGMLQQGTVVSTQRDVTLGAATNTASRGRAGKGSWGHEHEPAMFYGGEGTYVLIST